MVGQMNSLSVNRGRYHMACQCVQPLCACKHMHVHTHTHTHTVDGCYTLWHSKNLAEIRREPKLMTACSSRLQLLSIIFPYVVIYEKTQNKHFEQTT